MKMFYWIEESIVASIIGIVYVLILEEFYKNQNMNVPIHDYMSEKEMYEIDFFRELLKDAEITKPEHVDYYMNHQNIIALMS